MGQKDYLHRQGQSGTEDVHRKFKEEGAKPRSTTPDKGRWCVDVHMSIEVLLRQASEVGMAIDYTHNQKRQAKVLPVFSSSQNL